MAKGKAVPNSENIASALGDLSKKVDSWKQQRASIVAEAKRLATLANSLLEDLGVESGPQARAHRGGRPRGYRTSAATRAKLRAAWRRRKAAAGKPTRTLSPEARERIAAAQRKRWAEVRKTK